MASFPQPEVLLALLLRHLPGRDRRVAGSGAALMAAKRLW
jgi:hypothetical protein